MTKNTKATPARPAMPMRADGRPDLAALFARSRAEFGATRMDTTSLKEQAKQVQTALNAKRAEAAEKWTEFDALRTSAIKDGVDFTKDTAAFDKLDAAGKAHDVLAQEAAKLEATYARLLELAGETMPEGNTLGGDGPSLTGTAKASWGKRWVDSDEFKALQARVQASGSAAVGATNPVRVATREEIMAVLTGTVTTGDGAGGALLWTKRLDGIIGIPQAALNVLDLITIGETDERMVSWVVEVLFQNNAAETAENTTKPQSNFGFDDRDATVRDIAHWTKVTRQTLRDAAAIRSWLDNRMMYGVRRRLQQQVVSGDGTGVNLLGIYNQPGIIEHVKGTDPLVEMIHRMITKVRITYMDEPTAVGIHPTDWETVALSKAEGSGIYFYGGPAGQGPKTIWGLPVAVSVDFPLGSPAVADFKQASLWVREGVSVQATDTNEDDFINNRVTLRSEMAGAFGVLQPAGIAIAVDA